MTPASCIAHDGIVLTAKLGLEAAEARAEIRALLAHVLGVNRAWLITHEHDVLPAEQMAAYAALLARRLNGEPTAYLFGEKEFFGRRFKVAPGVLVPRPETELLVELALEKCATLLAPNILDMGTGSGCIAITLALESTGRVTALDSSAAALAIARVNAHQLGAAVQFYQGDWYQALPEKNAAEKFDLIVSNPPYIEANDAHLAALKHEPLQALASGEDGLQAIRCIVQGAPGYLKPGGWLMLEHGWDQAARVQTLLQAQGFIEVETRADLAGIGRVTLGKWT